jgi:hypothetical protein
VLLDAGEFLYRELAGAGDVLFREVHRLAFHYHWREADILALPGEKRRRYLNLVDEELAGSGRR